MRNMIGRYAVCLGVALVAAFASLTGEEVRQTQAAGVAQSLSTVAGTPRAKDFTLPDLDGQMHSLRDYRGKVVVLNFWATWCPPCRFEIPSMQRAQQALAGQNVVILAVHLGGSEDKVFEFLSDYDVTFTILMDKRSKVPRDWPFTGLPTTFVIAPDGRVVYRAIGGREWDDPAILQKLRALAGVTAGTTQ